MCALSKFQQPSTSSLAAGSPPVPLDAEDADSKIRSSPHPDAFRCCIVSKYIGSTGLTGLHHLVWEVVDNSIDEVMAGHASQAIITINEDNSVTVSDDGRGIPTDIHSVTGKSALETVMTVLHAGGKFGGDASGYTVSGGLHGVGVSVVNALSEWVSVRVRRDGVVYRMNFNRGVPSTKLEEVEADELYDGDFTTGTTVTFKPDSSVFKGDDGKPCVVFESKRLESRLNELAYLNKSLKLVLRDMREGGFEEKVSSARLALSRARQFERGSCCVFLLFCGHRKLAFLHAHRCCPTPPLNIRFTITKEGWHPTWNFLPKQRLPF